MNNSSSCWNIDELTEADYKRARSHSNLSTCFDEQIVLTVAHLREVVDHHQRSRRADLERPWWQFDTSLLR